MSAILPILPILFGLLSASWLVVYSFAGGAPEGFEDETGFHFGVLPVANSE